MTILLAALMLAGTYTEPDSRVIVDDLAQGHASAVAGLCIHLMAEPDPFASIMDYAVRHRLTTEERQAFARDCQIVAMTQILTRQAARN